MSVAIFFSWHLLAESVSGAPLLPKRSSLPPINPKNITSLRHDIAPEWVQSPNVRGTADILWSCIVTLALCVYTAIHLNIPAHSERRGAHYCRKAKWALLGIFAPEVVLYTAWAQWWSASKLARELTDLAGSSLGKNKDVEPESTSEQHEGSNSTRKTPLFDLTYGFYAIMGGFVVDLSSVHDTYTLFTLTPTGILQLAKEGHFLHIDSRSIKDKSKANMLAKSLVCLQVTSMLVQCITRKAAHYPLCLLELHTFVHVVCALGMYTLWFKKPLDVNDPTLVDGSNFEDMTALMLLYQPAPTREPYESRAAPLVIRTQYERNLLEFRYPELESSHNQAEETGSKPTDVRDLGPVLDGDYIFKTGDGVNLLTSGPVIRTIPELKAARTVKTGDYLPNKLGPRYVYSDSRTPQVFKPHVNIQPILGDFFDGFEARPVLAMADYLNKLELRRVFRKPQAFTIGKFPLEIHLSSKDLRRWDLAASRIERLWESIWGPYAQRERLQKPKEKPAAVLDLIYGENWVTHGLTLRSKNFSIFDGSTYNPFDSLDNIRLNWALPVILVALSSAYGGIHAAAWNFEFSSSAEHMIWRIACVQLSGYLVAIPAAVFVADIVGGSYTKLSMEAWLLRYFGKMVRNVVETLAIILVLIGILGFALDLPVYLASRIFIVLESFVSLRHVPLGVYAALSWPNYFPHI